MQFSRIPREGSFSRGSDHTRALPEVLHLLPEVPAYHGRMDGLYHERILSYLGLMDNITHIAKLLF